MLRTAVLVAMLLVPTGASADGPGYTVTIQPGVSPRMSPSTLAETVAAAARTRGAGDVTILSVECSDGIEFRSAYSDPTMRNGGPVWTVRLGGRFPNLHVPPGAHSSTGTAASYVIDDETGEAL